MGIFDWLRTKGKEIADEQSVRAEIEGLKQIIEASRQIIAGDSFGEKAQEKSAVEAEIVSKEQAIKQALGLEGQQQAEALQRLQADIFRGSFSSGIETLTNDPFLMDRFAMKQQLMKMLQLEGGEELTATKVLQNIDREVIPTKGEARQKLLEHYGNEKNWSADVAAAQDGKWLELFTEITADPSNGFDLLDPATHDELPQEVAAAVSGEGQEILETAKNKAGEMSDIVTGFVTNNKALLISAVLSYVYGWITNKGSWKYLMPLGQLVSCLPRAQRGASLGRFGH